MALVQAAIVPQGGLKVARALKNLQNRNNSNTYAYPLIGNPKGLHNNHILFRILTYKNYYP